MQQLSGADTASLYGEHGNTFNHVATLSIYDPSTHPQGRVRFKDVLAHFEGRLDEHAIFRRRLVEVPFGLDRPYWIEETEVDVEFHVRHIALPDPGDWRQLMIQVARLHSRPLDRSRPLWEIYVIDRLDKIPGLPPGCFALFSKFHHASVDGMAALHLLGALHTEQPKAAPRTGGARVRRGAEREPVAMELAARAVVHSAERAVGLARLAGTTVIRAAQAIRNDDRAEPHDSLFSMPARAPQTRFSAAISAHRVVEGTGIPLSAFKSLRANVPEATINDIFLAICGGALRRYLEAKGELPARTMNALMPISLRSDASAGGNEVTGVAVPLGSDITDPLARLRSVGAGARAAIRNSDRLGRDLIKQLMDSAPTPLADLALRKLLIPQLNTAVSNVRGPEGPLYLAGAKLMRLYPVSIAADHVGINHTAVSYGGWFWIGVVSCREMLPDPAFYMECLRDACAELFAAAGVAVVQDAAHINAEPASLRRAERSASPRVKARRAVGRRSRG